MLRELALARMMIGALSRPRPLVAFGLAALLVAWAAGSAHASAHASAAGHIEVQYDLEASQYDNPDLPPGTAEYFDLGPGTITIRYQDDGAGGILDGGTADVVHLYIDYQLVVTIPPIPLINPTETVLTFDYEAEIPDSRWDGVPGSPRRAPAGPLAATSSRSSGGSRTTANGASTTTAMGRSVVALAVSATRSTTASRFP